MGPPRRMEAEPPSFLAEGEARMGNRSWRGSFVCQGDVRPLLGPPIFVSYFFCCLWAYCVGARTGWVGPTESVLGQEGPAVGSGGGKVSEGPQAPLSFSLYCGRGWTSLSESRGGIGFPPVYPRRY